MFWENEVRTQATRSTAEASEIIKAKNVAALELVIQQLCMKQNRC